ncbi:hypothetical protein [Magnetovibrio blakemorei]|uniref:Sodium:proton antiporter n=1 Tax=Magnetovibrio blakemorei TaxID=28181 RepID=A0A1E5QAK1_9PROT|nr:hypothetical protein [Magnetovibrio blakemorei]OEJ69000.1 hypothetical protein BEN30_04580 [Magnetovibrio blakemorei]
MKKNWKGILIIAALVVMVPWFLAGFKADALGYWLQVAFALVLSALIVSPVVGLVERRFGEGAAGLVAFMLLPEMVLFFHFILFPRVEAWLFALG